METVSVWFFISSGLFLGWSLGANHAVNVFGTAVVSKMIKFRTAAVIAGIFVILGSVFSGEGTTKTLTDLGSINAIAGSFAVALAVAISVTVMTKYKLPVSTSQAVIGGIIGWNIFTGSPTNYNSLTKILLSWVTSPLIAALFGYILFKIVKAFIKRWKIHLLRLDNYTRIALVIVGALASYSLGANNIGNVMGMFIHAPLFEEFKIGDIITISSSQQMFLLGGLAIAVGIFTYGSNVMETVGSDLYKISPITGFVVVLAEFLVLWLFTSQDLQALLISINLPPIPLVPLSTTQAFIGAIIGVGMAKDPLSINFKVFGRIAIGWVIAPVTAGILTFISLFFIQNVFEQKIIHPISYNITKSVIKRLESDGIKTQNLMPLLNKQFDNNRVFHNEITANGKFKNDEIYLIYKYSLLEFYQVDSTLIYLPESEKFLNEPEINYLKSFHGKTFTHRIDFENMIIKNYSGWSGNKDLLIQNQINNKINYLENLFRLKELPKKNNKTLKKEKL